MIYDMMLLSVFVSSAHFRLAKIDLGVHTVLLVLPPWLTFWRIVITKDLSLLFAADFGNVCQHLHSTMWPQDRCVAPWYEGTSGSLGSEFLLFFVWFWGDGGWWWVMVGDGGWWWVMVGDGGWWWSFISLSWNFSTQSPQSTPSTLRLFHTWRGDLWIANRRGDFRIWDSAGNFIDVYMIFISICEGFFYMRCTNRMFVF